ncbi:MAG: hypothetical protein Q7V17_12365 [Afipia sp.]|nr:hypothetical protein [Afipia sp.]
MTLTEVGIRECTTDDELFKLLSAELKRLLPYEEGFDLNEFLEETRTIPIGLRAMAAIYQLDVSLTLDDLGWHFANWHHHGYCEETAWALKELEAFEQAELFAKGYAVAQPWWDKIGELLAEDFSAFVAWYPDSALDRATMPLTRRMWDLQEIDYGLLGYWTRHARKYPHKVVQRPP